MDCYRCGGHDCMTLENGVYVCQLCGRTWRKPEPIKPVRITYGKNAACAICGMELMISFDTGKTICGCKGA